LSVLLRLFSLGLLIAVWTAASQVAGARLLPTPEAVGLALVAEARSGVLIANLAAIPPVMQRFFHVPPRFSIGTSYDARS